MANDIKCPNCGHVFDVENVLAADMEQKYGGNLLRHGRQQPTALPHLERESADHSVCGLPTIEPFKGNLTSNLKLLGIGVESEMSQQHGGHHAAKPPKPPRREEFNDHRSCCFVCRSPCPDNLACWRHSGFRFSVSMWALRYWLRIYIVKDVRDSFVQVVFGNSRQHGVGRALRHTFQE